MDEKGIIKFECFHNEGSLEESIRLSELIKYRNLAYQKGFIGVYPNGIGFGNISLREENGFLVSGSATGCIKIAKEAHFSWVTKWNVQKNQVWCEGPIKASSESMTHAVIYDSLPEVNAILHIHSEKLWKQYYHDLASTAADIEYGTPAMAEAVIELLNSKNFSIQGVFLMQGHEDGIVAFGTSLKEVLNLNEAF